MQTKHRLSFLSRLHTYLQWRKRTLCAVIIAALSPTFVFANPNGAQVISGQVTIDQSIAGITTVTNSPSAIINWQDFNIAQNEITRFVQQNGQSAVLNRIIGGNPSEILGSLFSNGKVFLINPNGIVFGAGSQIDTQGLIASSLNLSDSDFQKGNFHFVAGSKAGDISNEGIIHAGKDGNIVLIAPNIENKGIIHSEGGKIVLAAGQELVLTSLDEPDIRFQVQAPKNHVLNVGELLSEGGSINVFAGSIKHSGDISADSIEVDKQGNIRLVAKGDVTLEKDSKTSANNEKGVAGKIEITGENVTVLDNSKLNASGQKGGGEILIGGDYQGKNLAIQNAQTTTIAEKVEIKADAKTQGQGGKVIVWSDNETKVAATISAKGGNKSGGGGLVETSGHNKLEVNGTKVDTSAKKGKTGTWLLDPVDFTVDSSNVSTLTAGLTTNNVNILSSSGNTGTNGDLFINAPISWSSNYTLTLNAQRHIDINASITGSGTSSKLALEYGQGAVAAGNTATYNVRAPINLPAGNNFSTKSGSNGDLTNGGLVNYTVITDLGNYNDHYNGIGICNYSLQGLACADLRNLNFVLGANIDASATSEWNLNGAAYEGFDPIGNVNYSFAGKFDGLGHTISNLTINRPSTSYVGLFGYVGSGSKINNVGLVGGSVTGQTGVGGLIGYNNYATVNNSYNTGVVSGTNYVGGLIGYNDDYATVSNSYSTAVVSGANAIGGLIGYNDSATMVSNTYSTGAVSGTGSYVGGLSGRNYGTVSNSYSTGAVLGSQYVGGLIGDNYGTVSNNYSTGAVSGTLDAGGLIGYSPSGTVSNSFWNIETSAQITSAGGIGKTTAEMMTQSSFTGWDFTNTWWMSDTNTRPFLRSEWSTTITNAHQLQLMASNLSASYTLGKDLDLSAELSNVAGMWNTTTKFLPIGNNSTPFTGSFDGLNHTISSLTINRPTTDYVGLFGDSSGGIQNVGLLNVSVSGKNNTGGLVGWNHAASGIVNNSFTTGNVSGGTDGTGGLIGTNSMGEIRNSYSTSSVSGTNSVGGLLGYQWAGNVSNSYSIGSVSGSSWVGGLLGVNNSGSVSSSYSTGSVSGGYAVGGLVGETQHNTATGTVTNSFWDIETSGQATSSGGTGLTTAQMMVQANFTGFDFTNTWWMSDTNTRPFLRSEWSTNITNAHQLQLMSSNLSANYTLAKNLDLSAELSNASGMWNTTTKFLPIGNNSTPFTGSFDGLNHTISNLTINHSRNYVGLFGYSSGTIQDVGLTNVNVTGSDFVGGLLGGNVGNVSNSYSTGVMNGLSDVGGLLGWNVGNVSNSYSTGEVSGIYNVGGLLGLNDAGSGSVNNSYSTGAVSGQTYIGGLVGSNAGSVSNSYSMGAAGGGSYIGGLVGSNAGSVSNSYSTTAVNGGTYIGGLLGWNAGSVSNSYSTGAVSGISSVGGLLGYNSGTASNSFWDTQTSGQSISAGGTGKTTAEIMSVTTLTALNNGSTTWNGIADTSYPYLSWQFATTPQIMSGLLSGSSVSGKTITYAIDGVAKDSLSTGANGFFYQALPASSVTSGQNLLAWLDNDTNKGAEVVVSDGGHLTNLSITPNTVLAFSATDLEASALVLAKGSLSDTDIPYTVTSQVNNSTEYVEVPAGIDLTLKANDSILAGMWTNITTHGGDVVFNANANNVGTGNIQFLADGSGASITTNGGNIIMGGGVCTATGCTESAIGVSDVGIRLNSATLNSGGGLINLKGEGATGASFLVGVDIQNSTISGGAGNITLQGTGGSGNGFNNGVRIYNSTMTNTGATTIIGKGVGDTDVANSINGNFNSGVYLELATLTNGSLNIIGSGGDVLLSGNVIDGNTGVEMWDSHLTTTGAMTITGIGNGTGVDNYGISTTASTLKSGSGVLTLDGFSSTNAGLYFDYGTVIGDATGGQTGNIVLIADNDTTAIDDAIVFANTTYPLLTSPNPIIQGTGSLSLETFYSTSTIGLAGGDGHFNLNSSELSYIGTAFSSVNIGNTGSSAALTIGGTGDGILNVIAPTLTLHGNVTNDGTIKVGGFNSLGTLNVAGNFSQTANGALTLDLGGTTTGQFDKVAVTGNVVLDGALNAALFNNYSPVNNDAIPFLTKTGTASNTFATVNVPANFYAGYNLYAGEATRFTYSTSTDKFFTNAANDLNWATATNWTNNTLPTSSNDVLINSGFTVAHATGTDSVKSLTVNTGNGLNVSGGSLTVSGLSTINGALNVTGAGIFTPASTGITGTGAINYDVTSDLTLPLISATTVNVKSTGNIVLPVSTSITTNGGAVTLNSDSDTTNGGGIVLDSGSSITTNGGAITLGGGANPLTGYATGNATYLDGIRLGSSPSNITLNSAGGDITLRGKSSNTADGGNLKFGIKSYGGLTLNSGAGKILIEGKSIGSGSDTSSNHGIEFSVYGGGGMPTLITSTNATPAAISITGDATGTTTTAGAIGVVSQSIGIIATNGGGITVTGKGSTIAQGYRQGVFFKNSDILSNGGAISVDGASDGTHLESSSIGFKSGSLVTASNSNITLTQDVLESLGTTAFKSTGALTIQPYTANTTIGIAGGTGTLQLPASYFATNFANGFSNINIGSATASAITLGGALTVPTSANLTLQNAGDMALNGALTLAANKTLTLNSTGNVTQTAPITATNLLLLSAGNYALNNVNNIISNLAANGVGNLSFVNSTAFAIDSVAGTNGINATGTVDISTYNGNLTVNQPVLTSNTTADALKLNAGSIETTSTTANIVVGTNGSFSVGTGGIGKFFTGSIIGSTGLANFIPVGNSRYNSDESVANYTAAITAAGKYAIYREQPKLRVNPNAATSSYGDTIASLSGTVNTSDYINGDSGGVTGTPTFTTTATSSSHVGNYDVAYASGYSSAVGYGFADDTITGGEYSVTPRMLTPTLTNTGVTKVYDKTTTTPANFTPTFSYSGFATGDTDATVTHSAASYNSKDVATANTITVSGLALGSIAGTRGSLISDYVLDATSKNVAATITAKALAITATGSNKTYDASTIATINLADDRISGDVLTTSYTTAAFADKNVGTAKTINISGIGITGTDASNYSFNTTTTASADITQAALSITANAVSKTYGGIDPTLTYSATGLISGDTLTGGLTRASGENTGIYAISSTLDNPNYAITYIPADFTITAATLALAITADNTTRIYGAVNPTFTGQITTGGLQVGDTLASIGLSFSTTATQFSDVGNYPIIPSITSQNYVFSGTNGILSITPASLTLTGLSASNKVYDATTNAVLNGGTLAGILNSDDVTLNGALVGQFADKNVGTGKVVTISNYGLTGTKAANYTLTAPTGIVANITPATLNITAKGTNKIYDGLTTTTVDLADNRISGDVLTTSYTTAAFADKNVGTAKTINVSGIGITGTDASNYTFNTAATTSADITQAALSIAANAGNKIYGTANPVLTYTTTGLISGDTLSGSLTRTNGENVGTYAIANNLVNTNYTIAYTPANFTITPAALSISANTANKVYGTTDPALTYRAVGLVNGDTLSGSLSRASGENVGNYAIQSNLTNSNYIISYMPADFTITPAALSITANAASKVYGSADVALTYSAVGLISGDSLSGSLSRVGGENVGRYAIQGNLTNDNYTITYTPADFTITPAALNIAANAMSKVYGTTDSALTYSATGLRSGDTLTGALTRTAGENVGNYAIQSNLTNSNYVITYTPANFSITPATLNVKANSAGKVYGTVDPALTYTATGLLGSDTLTGNLTRAVGENVGNYAIQSNLANSNYTITYTPADFNITPAALSIAANVTSKVYGTTDPALTYTATGLLGSDTLTGNLTRAVGENVGNYAIQSNLANSNYTIAYTPADFNITPAALNITANAASKVYGTVDPALTYQTVGLIAGDTLEGGLSRAEGKDVGTYPITGNFNNANYTITYAPADFTITPAALSVTANAASKIYGETEPALTYQTTGLIEGDTLEGGVTRAEGKDVGIYPITGNFNHANYTITYAPADFTITPATLNITANSASKIYGDADPELTYKTVGLIEGDTLEGSMTRTAGETVAKYGITGTFNAGKNYTVSFVPSELEITPAALQLAANDKTKLFGEPDPVFDYTVTGLKRDDTKDAVLSGNLSRDLGEEVAFYGIHQGDIKANSNYILNYQGAKLEIKPVETIPAGSGSDSISGESTTDTITSSSGTDTISGGSPTDTVTTPTTDEAARLEAERLAAEQAAKAEAERLAAEQAARLEAERLAAEQAAKAEADRLAAEQAARLEAERLAAEQAAKEEADRLAAEQAAKLEADRLAAEQAAKEEADRLAAEQAAKVEAERLTAEQAAKVEADRLAAEQAAKIEAERLAAEQAAKVEAERLAEEAAKLKAEQERLIAEKTATPPTTHTPMAEVVEKLLPSMPKEQAQVIVEKVDDGVVSQTNTVITMSAMQMPTNGSSMLPPPPPPASSSNNSGNAPSAAAPASNGNSSSTTEKSSGSNSASSSKDEKGDKKEKKTDVMLVNAPTENKGAKPLQQCK